MGRTVPPGTTEARSKRASFAAFVADHERRLRQALTAALGADAGREAAADALAYGWEHWDRVSTMENPGGYLFVVGRDRSRRARRRRQGTGVLPPGRDEQPPWFEPRLVKVLESLPDRQRIAVLLVHGFDWSFSEVAEMLGLSKSTVQTHVERGMASLRAGLGVQR
jgi:RNA polymerase sigma factor (sigma-70 family)